MGLPTSTLGWALAIIGMLMMIGISWWKIKNDRDKKDAEDKRDGGGKAGKDAQGSAEQNDKVRDETDEFLGRKK